MNNDEKFPYCKHNPRGKYDKERKEMQWDESAARFISDPDRNWEYDFCDEASLSDREQSFLSRFVFAKLLNINEKEIVANSIGLTWEGTEFHLDIMNHEKEYIKYHSIGNFTLIPGKKYPYTTKKNKEISAHLQMIHKWKGEKWDLLLDYLKSKWQEKIKFKDYMVATCQQLYFKSVFDKFYNKYKDTGSLKKINWIKELEQWNKQLERDSDLDFVDLGDSREEKINFLIEARGRCILSILQSKKLRFQYFEES